MARQYFSRGGLSLLGLARRKNVAPAHRSISFARTVSELFQKRNAHFDLPQNRPAPAAHPIERPLYRAEKISNSTRGIAAGRIPDAKTDGDNRRPGRGWKNRSEFR